MNLLKSYKFLDPNTVTERIHIIGCGSVGSTIAELLARYGLTDIVLYDFDVVDSHNIVNQMFVDRQVGMKKVSAVEEILKGINPDISVRKVDTGWTGQKLDGYVFLCVDNIDLRNEIVDDIMWNPNVQAVFDVRTGLTTAQAYYANWSSDEEKSWLKSTMNFTKEEANLSTPVSGCNIAESVAATLRLICSWQVANFVNMLRDQKTVRMLIVNTDTFEVITL